jgi:polar amino acid transport system permease protein
VTVRVPTPDRPAPHDPDAAERRFRIRVALVWLAMLGLVVLAFQAFDLKTALIVEKLPFLLGLRLTPNGFVQGLALTLLITVGGMVCSIVLGVLCALGRISRNPVAFGIATFYASFFRGTPLLVQVLIIYLGLPPLGLVIDALPAGILALSLNYGAYLAEIFRAGILAVPSGQREAAMSLGLPRWLIAVKIIGPQAMRVIIPPTFTNFVSMLKDSSLVSIMGLWELNFLAQSYGRASFRFMEMLLTAAVIYWCAAILLEIVQNRLERRFGKGFAAGK